MILASGRGYRCDYEIEVNCCGPALSCQAARQSNCPLGQGSCPVGGSDPVCGVVMLIGKADVRDQLGAAHGVARLLRSDKTKQGGYGGYFGTTAAVPSELPGGGITGIVPATGGVMTGIDPATGGGITGIVPFAAGAPGTGDACTDGLGDSAGAVPAGGTEVCAWTGLDAIAASIIANASNAQTHQGCGSGRRRRSAIATALARLLPCAIPRPLHQCCHGYGKKRFNVRSGPSSTRLRVRSCGSGGVVPGALLPRGRTQLPWCRLRTRCSLRRRAGARSRTGGSGSTKAALRRLTA